MRKSSGPSTDPCGTPEQGGQQPGKPGKVREFKTGLENLEKSGNFIYGQGKLASSI